MNLVKMRKHLAGADERRKEQEALARAYFESGLITKEKARIIMLPPWPQPQLHPWRDRYRRVTSASRPSVETTPAQP
jgi:hypothetical protein